MGSAVCAASKTPTLMKQLCPDLGQFSVGKKCPRTSYESCRTVCVCRFLLDIVVCFCSFR